MLLQRRCFACSSWTWLTCPLLCIAKCAVFAVMSLTPLSWRSGRFLRSVPEILLLQYIDKVVVVFYVQSCGRQSSSHSRSLDKVVDMPVVFNDNTRGSACRKLQWSRSCRAFLRWPMSLLCRSCWCHFLRPWTRCDHAATSLFSSTVEVPLIRSSPESMDILLCNQPCWLWRRCRGCRRILRHFSCSSGCPGVERQFFEPSSAHTCESSRAPGVPESPGVLLPGDLAQGLCHLALATCSGFSLVSRQPSSKTTTKNKTKTKTRHNTTTTTTTTGVVHKHALPLCEVTLFWRTLAGGARQRWRRRRHCPHPEREKVALVVAPRAAPLRAECWARTEPSPTETDDSHHGVLRAQLLCRQRQHRWSVLERIQEQSVETTRRVDMPVPCRVHGSV